MAVGSKSSKRPQSIPSSPNSVYTEWKDICDWLGYDFLQFEEGRTFARGLGLKTCAEWQAWANTGC
jgi:hypothetical protein